MICKIRFPVDMISVESCIAGKHDEYSEKTTNLLNLSFSVFSIAVDLYLAEVTHVSIKAKPAGPGGEGDSKSFGMFG